MGFQVPLGHLPEDRLAAQISYFSSASDVEVSFLQPGFMSPWGGSGSATIRDASGGLVLLGTLAAGGALSEEGESVALETPGWASDGSAWLSPFGGAEATNLGCAPIEPFRTVEGFSNVEIPLAVQFETDLGEAQVFDRTTAFEVSVGGLNYDVYAAYAFTRDGTGCAVCSATEVGILVLRSLP